MKERKGEVHVQHFRAGWSMQGKERERMVKGNGPEREKNPKEELFVCFKKQRLKRF